MNLKQYYLTNNECYQRNVYITVKGLMLHSTGANNPNLKRYIPNFDGTIGENLYGNHWDQFRPGNKQVCVHGFIGKLEDGSIATVQTLPWNMKGWHAGGDANNSYIGVEICEDDLTDGDYFNKVYNEAVELFAYLCKEFNLNPLTNIICHCEGHKKGIASNHSDVMHWFPKHGKSMDTFREDVQKKLQGTETLNELPNLSSYNGNSIVDGLNSVGYDSSYASRKELATKLGISNYSGTAEQNLKMIELLKGKSATVSNTQYLSNPTYTGVSIVSALNEIGVDSSYANRKEIAIRNGISNYKGTAEQNTELLNKLKNGTLKK